MDSFVESSIEAIREKVGDGKVLLSVIRRRGFICGGRTSFQSYRKAADLRIC